MPALTSQLTRLLALTRNAGLRAAARSIVDRVQHKLVAGRIIELLSCDVESMATEDVPLPDGFALRVLSPEDIEQFSVDSSLDLEPEMANLARDARCFRVAVTKDGQLAAYAWYLLEDVPPEHHFGLAMTLPNGTAYLFKAFTRPDCRGLRLQGAATQWALRLLAEQHSVRTAITSIDWTNHASLRCFKRAGFQRLGRALTIGHQPRLIYHSPCLKPLLRSSTPQARSADAASARPR